MKRKIIIKTIITICMIITFAFLSPFIVSANEGSNDNYSDNYYLVLRESDIDFSLYNQDYLNDLINEVFYLLNNDPSAIINYNYSVSQKLAMQIKDFYLDYYNLNSNKNVNHNTRYVLQNSLVKNNNGEWVNSGGAWDDRYYEYNCYAFSINRYEEDFYYDCNYGHYNVGFFSNREFGLLETITVEKVKEKIKYDLAALGFTNINHYYSMPSDLADDVRLICCRTCSTDFHVMRYDNREGVWYHKPGPSAILKYNSIIENSGWIQEGSIEGVESSGDKVYTSSVIYITYSINNIHVSCHTAEANLIKSIAATKDCLIETNIYCDRNYSFVFMQQIVLNCICMMIIWMYFLIVLASIIMIIQDLKYLM